MDKKVRRRQYIEKGNDKILWIKSNTYILKIFKIILCKLLKFKVDSLIGLKVVVYSFDLF